MEKRLTIQDAIKIAKRVIHDAPDHIKQKFGDGIFIGSAVEFAKLKLLPKTANCTRRMVWVLLPTSNRHKYALAPFCLI